MPKRLVLILVNTITDCLCLVFINVNCNIPSVICKLLASVSNDDSNAKRMAKNRKNKQTNNSFRLAKQNFHPFFVHFLAVFAHLRRETAKFHVFLRT